MASKKKYLALLALILLTLVCYYPSLSGEFFWDDELYITKNADLKEFNLRSLLTRNYAGNYHPLTMISLAVEYRLLPDKVFVHHSVNIILHIICVLLVYLLMLFLSRNRLFAWVVAAFFAFHPLQVESVAWISQRKSLLNAGFFILALIYYLKYIRSKNSWRDYGFSLAFFAVSLLCKPMSVTLPALLFLIDFHESRPFLNSKYILEKLPFLVFSCLCIVLTLMAQRTDLFIEDRSLSALAIIQNTFSAFIFYFSNTLAPINLSVLYEPSGYSTSDINFIIFGMMMLALGYSLFKSERFSRPIIFGLLFFLITLSPVLGIIPFGGHQLFADRYYYLPSIGLLYAILVIIRNAVLRQKIKSLQMISFLLVGAYFFCFCYLTFTRASTWQSTENLWQDTIRKYPKTLTAYFNLGSYYYNKKKYNAAIAILQQAIAVEPTYYQAHNYLGLAYMQINDLETSEKHLNTSVSVSPKSAIFEAYHYLGILWSNKHNNSQAQSYFIKSINANNHYVDSWLDLIKLSIASGNLTSAKDAIKKALKVNPNDTRLLELKKRY